MVAIVQARMGSARRPGKVLAPIGGRPLLDQQLRRLARAECLDEIVVATTKGTDDDAIVETARTLGYRTIRGSRDDVLSRYRKAAQASAAEVIVRITADCPLIDPEVTDRVVRALTGETSSADYASNVLARTYPLGLDVEAFFLDTLLRMDRFAESPAEREHVTTVARATRARLFSAVSVTDEENNADLRWTVDEEADLRLVRRLFDELSLSDEIVGYRDIIAYLRSNPEIAAMNAHVTHRPEAAPAAGEGP